MGLKNADPCQIKQPESLKDAISVAFDRRQKKKILLLSEKILILRLR